MTPGPSLEVRVTHETQWKGPYAFIVWRTVRLQGRHPLRYPVVEGQVSSSGNAKDRRRVRRWARRVVAEALEGLPTRVRIPLALGRALPRQAR